ncbi:MAG: hypothetical protein JWN22_1388 [Nocardioides sp.]|nr:hypothetical protein [Nocardioides sp.]
MPSAEGRGLAKAAWGKYVSVTNRYLQPVIDATPLGDGIRSVSANSVSDLVGFWVLWHLYGGFEGLQGLGMSRSSIFRKVAMFRKIFGKHPDEFTLPGVTIDVKAYLAGGGSEDSGN